MNEEEILIFKFTQTGNRFEVYYDEEADTGPKYHKIVGAILKLMQENPGLIEEFAYVVNVAANELNKPFEDILK